MHSAASWISTNSLLARYNLAALLVQGDREVLREAGRGMRMPAGAQNRMRRMPLEAVEPSRLFDKTERADTTALLALDDTAAAWETLLGDRLVQ